MRNHFVFSLIRKAGVSDAEQKDGDEKKEVSGECTDRTTQNGYFAQVFQKHIGIGMCHVFSPSNFQFTSLSGVLKKRAKRKLLART
jgi:hypothetical protein